MKKLYVISFILLIFGFSCSPHQSMYSPERDNIVDWAIKIVDIRLDYKETNDKFYILQRKLGSSDPTNDDIFELENTYETISGFYTKINKIIPPTQASSVHRKIKEQYSLASDAILQYYISVIQNDLIYYEKSVENAKEADRIGDLADDEFIELLSKYSISCSEIGLCE